MTLAATRPQAERDGDISVDMHRRQLIRVLLSLPITAALLHTPLATMTVRAVEPATVLAVVTAASSLIRLFTPTGPGVPDLLRLQTELLVKLSEQLGVLQRNMELILSRLEDIQKLLGRLPEQVVSELFRRRITGTLGIYRELIATYEEDVRTVGIREAQKRNSRPFETEVLRPLRESRSILFSYPSYINAPVLAAGLYAEVHSMILANYNTSRMKPVLGSYETWFVSALDGSDDSIRKRSAAHRAERGRLAEEIPKLTYRDDCLLRRTQFPPQNPICGSGTSFLSISAKTAVFGYQAAPVPLTDLSKDVAELTSVKLLSPVDLPMTVAVGPIQRTVNIVAGSGCTGDSGTVPPRSTHPDLIAEDQQVILGYNPRQCAARDIAGAMSERAKEVSAAMEESGYALVSLAALEHCCDTTLSAVRRFRSELDKPRALR